jgi:hypothetical protein
MDEKIEIEITPDMIAAGMSALADWVGGGRPDAASLTPTQLEVGIESILSEVLEAKA